MPEESVEPHARCQAALADYEREQAWASPQTTRNAAPAGASC
jgi:hypothetical protein